MGGESESESELLGGGPRAEPAGAPRSVSDLLSASDSYRRLSPRTWPSPLTSASYVGLVTRTLTRSASNLTRPPSSLGL